ncbi:organic hydroperoxide resistance protein [Mucilaginibacter polytrichastri]|uniref:Organic hydroperoxide resistance protein n=1 Tax=Mucilaginibacter polytrichastri TaxID=1302689 RepID=A0A1Q5ZW53_9SPHI|nr:organic hydroperoxide resistance protein [Mucilaginibacter polytrichastri]OKS86004.1 Organic hydroperoxide resistance protein [Mucilaginibacter polytrichastri]SFS59790.1 peroxiredoxin, Ohr subfamily [Mucilaginibacter polytrichastri]
MSVKALYTAAATATGGRNGHVSSSDNVLNLEVRMPKELGGTGGAYTNPEQLFAAGYAACFDSALNLVIKNAKLNITDTAVRAHVGIGANETGGFGLVVTLEVNIPGVEKADAALLVEKAHQVCPYSNATRGNVEVTLTTTTVPATEF